MLASDKKKSFGEWLKFLEYRNTNGKKRLCRICNHWHDPNDVFICVLSRPFKVNYNVPPIIIWKD